MSSAPEPSAVPVVSVDPYRVADADAIRRLFLETAFLGTSFERYFDDGPWLATFMLDPYLQLAPENCWVARWDGRIIGYLTGTTDTREFRRRWSRAALPRLLAGLLRPSVWARRRNWRFFLSSFRSARRGDYAYSDAVLDAYPAHFHLNVAADARALGAGQALWRAFGASLSARRVRGVHARTARSDGRHPFFERLGFSTVERHSLSVWSYLDPKSYELITYAKTLLG